MIYKFRATIDEDKEFMMDIEIKDDQTFYDFHQFIQEELEYDKSYLASFYIASHSWKPIIEIPQIIMNPDSPKKVVTMKDAILRNFIKDAHQKLLYLFDNIYNRSLKLELIETKQENPDFYYPVCTDFKGEIPPQISPPKTDLEDEEENLKLLHPSRTIYYPEINVGEIEDDINIPSATNLNIPEVPEDFILDEDIETPTKDLPDTDIINDKEAETIITTFSEEDIDDETFDEFIIKKKETTTPQKQELHKSEKVKIKEQINKKAKVPRKIIAKETKVNKTGTNPKKNKEKISKKQKKKIKKENKAKELKDLHTKITKDTKANKTKTLTTPTKVKEKKSEKQKVKEKKETKTLNLNKSKHSKKIKQNVPNKDKKIRKKHKPTNKKNKKKKK